MNYVLAAYVIVGAALCIYGIGIRVRFGRAARSCGRHDSEAH